MPRSETTRLYRVDGRWYSTAKVAERVARKRSIEVTTCIVTESTFRTTGRISDLLADMLNGLEIRRVRSEERVIFVKGRRVS